MPGFYPENDMQKCPLKAECGNFFGPDHLTETA
jgi:hypothetical protein